MFFSHSKVALFLGEEKETQSSSRYATKFQEMTQVLKIFLFFQKQEQKNKELDEQLKEYIAEWRKQRAKEEDELKRLKEKQAKRKVPFLLAPKKR